MQGLLNYIRSEMPIWIVQVPVILIVITIHEYFHAWTAWKLGDTTPVETGRLSLNPLRHLDPLGTIALLLFHVGWARPVMIDFAAFKHPRRDTVLVSLAGPASNFATAIVAYLLLLFVRSSPAIVTRLPYVYEVLEALVVVSLGLGLFNLLPIPPLDGSKAFFALFFKRPERFLYDRAVDLYGTVILLALLWFNVITVVMSKVLNFILYTLLRL
ncbi:site-2 protease family protein [Candidatus Cryosericum septentrionale]|jgi:Zn-dependent protease|uniref:Site-2 protease family protein n=1 Tax=Candidatus Cryosericum septentrionale TaxID=2290913 RepID=A0A398DRW3_9BACT|nr:site-2 protease family protein [Candidatus Cryosericum septentrionale]